MTQDNEQVSTSALEILYLTKAHNRGEITFDQWLKLSREWAEAVIMERGTDEDKAQLQQTLERIREREASNIDTKAKEA